MPESAGHTREQQLVRVQDVVIEHLREHGQETGANLGHVLRREIPGFSTQDLGFPSLTRLLQGAADQLVIVGKKGDDWIWALGESLSDQALDRALGAEIDPTTLLNRPPSALITSVELLRFRSCQEVRLALAGSGPTALVGPNGSGKSTLLMGISYASQVTRGRLRALFSGRRDVRRLRTAGDTRPMELALHAGPTSSLRLIASPMEEDTQFEVSFKSGNKRENWRSPGFPPDPPLSARPGSRLYWPSVLLRFRAEALASPSDVVEGEPKLAFDGGGLPTLLAHLATTDPDRLDALVDSVRQVVPAVEKTRQTLRRWTPEHWTSPTDGDESRMQYQLDVKVRGNWIPADLLSEGTLFAFGLHAVLQQRVPPRILLMDDVDRGLHPKAQRALIQQLNQISATGGPQVVISTHSPYMLDELPADNVRVVRANGNGTQVRSLTAHPDWQEWQASMTSGEFWTYVGEEWLEKAP